MADVVTAYIDMALVALPPPKQKSVFYYKADREPAALNLNGWAILWVI